MRPAALGIPPFLREPVFLILFLWVVVALGYRALRLLRVPLRFFTVWERGVVCAAIGAGLLQGLPLALSSFGRLTPGAVRLAVGVLVLLLARDMLHVALGLRAALRELEAPSRVEIAWLTILGLSLAILALRSMVLGDFGDDDGYHLTAPRRWLQTGTLGYLPTYTHTNASMGFEMLYVIALALWDAEGAKLLHFGAALLCLCALYLSARRLAGVVAGATAGMTAVSLFLIPNRVYDVPFLASLAYNDLAVCWMTMTGVLAWLVWREHRQSGLLICSSMDCCAPALSHRLPSGNCGN